MVCFEYCEDGKTLSVKGGSCSRMTLLYAVEEREEQVVGVVVLDVEATCGVTAIELEESYLSPPGLALLSH